MKTNIKNCDEYGFKLKDIVVTKTKSTITVSAYYKNFHTDEESYFTINMDRKSFIYDNLKLSTLIASLKSKNIVDGFRLLLESKGKNDSFDKLISEFPESVLLNQQDVIASITSRYSENPEQIAEIEKAFASRRKILLDSITSKNTL